MAEKIALLLDGGFVKKKLSERLKRFPVHQDILQLCQEILQKPRLADQDLFRIYYYDAPPHEGTARNPIDGSVVDFSNSPQASRNRALIDTLELQPDFAVRRGVLIQGGWKLGSSALRNLAKSPRVLTASDLVPDLKQKGVDIRIGLDIASIALKRVAQILVLVTGDSDFVPPMKLARTEGLKVYLETLGHGVKRDLKAHADYLL
jgi:uncharacterized LabA/DUF88 family protein